MRTTKKIISVVLAACMLASTSAVTGFAATADESVSAGSFNQYSSASQKIDEQYAYTKGDLGATYSSESTTFKVWSPTATAVSVNLFTTGSDSEPGASDMGTYELEKDMSDGDWNGVWVCTVQQDLKNVYYTYSITTTDVTGKNETTNETQDIYSVATGVNGERSMVCDLDSTDPDGWDEDTHVLLDQSTESQVWELHIKDFSYDESSGVSEENRGKYLAFTENDTTLNSEGDLSTCIDYLKELGITTVQLNPFYDFQSVKENGDDDQFNWGYDPQNYNVPEGSYSSNPYDGNVRVTECKQMIQALHSAGISVVMDVVYNHTYNTDSSFQKTVPNYYYRMMADGTFSNGSGCGNECATERAMYRDFVIQSVQYWVNEYHVDGFRFDLMGLMDVETMNLLRDALDSIDTRITTWGEGWTGGTSTYPPTTCTGAEFVPATQANASKVDSDIAFFNDSLRDGIKGSVFTATEGGFIQGESSKASTLRAGARAQTRKYSWQAQTPAQCVNYAACHDNATLYDKILTSTDLANFGERSEEALKMNKLAAAILNSSQGISFVLAGEEMARTKYGDTNSYKSSPEINSINWNNLVEYGDLVSYYKGLMELRSHFSPLTASDLSYFDSFTFTGKTFTTKSNQVGWVINNDQEDEWQTMTAVFNSADTEAQVELPSTSVSEWVIIANGSEAGVVSLGEIEGTTFTVPACSAIIAVDKASFDALNVDTDMGKVKVNYVYGKTGEQLTDSVVLKGTIGTSFVTTESSTVPETYILDYCEGPVSGYFDSETQEVTYVYTDYVPDSILEADFDGDGYVTIADATFLQKYIVGMVDYDGETSLDLNYDGSVNVRDVIMLQKYLIGISVSTGTVNINYFYFDEDFNQHQITDTVTITGRVGSYYSSDTFRVVGYEVLDVPEDAEGLIPYGKTLNVDYVYTASSLDITLHVKHNGSLTWAPSLWIWGSDLTGKDKGNYTGGTWPGVTMEQIDSNGWYKYDFTYEGAGTYNVIVSDNGKTQTKDYKGFVDNEMWVVIDDSIIDGGSFLTFYTENPDQNPDAPIAETN